MPCEISVEAKVDPEDVLNNIDDDHVANYLENRGYLINTPSITSPEVMAYYHGDFNLKNFLKEIGLEEARKVLQELEAEIA